jgi:hypothetical protein
MLLLLPLLLDYRQARTHPMQSKRLNNKETPSAHEPLVVV